jgi:hypothetical protein
MTPENAISSWAVPPASASRRMPPFLRPCRRKRAGKPASVAHLAKSLPSPYFEQVGSVPGTRLGCRSLSLEDIMVKQNHGIVQDERGQDQPASKKAAHRSEPTVPKDAYELDPRDVREGVYDPVNDEGKPQPDKFR